MAGDFKFERASFAPDGTCGALFMPLDTDYEAGCDRDPHDDLPHRAWDEVPELIVDEGTPDEVRYPAYTYLLEWPSERP